MFTLISSILFSIASNIDNFPIGISYGIKKIHIPLTKNIFICVITSIVTFFSMLIGQNISSFFNIKIANIIGSSLLILLGIYPIISNIIFKKKNIDKNETKNILNKNKNKITNNHICIKELLLIILTICLNNIAAGIAASITGVNILCTTICTFIFGSILLYIGNNLGKKINNKLIKKYSEIISSVILILIGFMEIFI